MTVMHAVDVKQRQNTKMEMVFFRVDESDVSAVATAKDGLDEGSNQATILKNGTGDYTFTWKRPTRRTPVLVGLEALGNATVSSVTIGTTTCQVVFSADTDFHATFAMPYDKVDR